MRTGAVIALCMLAVIIAGGVLLTAEATAVADRCMAAAHEIETLVAMGEWTRAEAACREYAGQWETSRNILDLLLPRESLDSVTKAYEELGTGIAFRNAERCAEVCGELKRNAEDVRGNETLTIENLL